MQLNELKLNYHISIRNIRGEKDDAISDCYGQSCKDIPDAKKRNLCKEGCHQRILQDTLTKLSGLVGKCHYADNPSACRRSVGRMIRIYKDRISTSKGRSKDIKSEIIASKAIKRRE
jgi:hypothetical protein